MPPPQARRRRSLLADAGFQRLLTVRLVGQFGDGLLQVGLASFVFFSPERAATPERIAAGFAVLLLPFCLVGPFAGVLLDRWSRQRVLLLANTTRAAGLVVLALLADTGAENPGFYVTALVILGINRFILAGLSASLPQVVARRDLVVANSLAPTAGTVATVLGASAGVLIRHWVGVDDFGTAVVLFTSAAVCLLAGVSALRFTHDALGPIAPTTVRLRHSLGDVGRGFAAGIRHLGQRPAATRALLVMTGHRFLYGVTTVMGILLFRNDFFRGDVERAFGGLGLAVGAAGLGVLVGAALTPWGTRRWGTNRWTGIALAGAAVAQLALVMALRTSGLVAASFALGVVAQIVKIGVDAVLQRHIDDGFRGRVFTIYDLLFNVAYVAAAALAALVLPSNGRAPWSVVAVSIGYVALAVWYSRPHQP